MENFSDEIVETYLIRDHLEVKNKNTDDFTDISQKYKPASKTDIISLKADPIKTNADRKRCLKKVHEGVGGFSDFEQYWSVIFNPGDLNFVKEFVISYRTQRGGLINVYVDWKFPISIKIENTLNDPNVIINFEINRADEDRQGKTYFLDGSPFLFVYFSLVAGIIVFGIMQAIMYLSKEVID